MQAFLDRQSVELNRILGAKNLLECDSLWVRIKAATGDKHSSLRRTQNAVRNLYPELDTYVWRYGSRNAGTSKISEYKRSFGDFPSLKHQVVYKKDRSHENLINSSINGNVFVKAYSDIANANNISNLDIKNLVEWSYFGRRSLFFFVEEGSEGKLSEFEDFLFQIFCKYHVTKFDFASCILPSIQAGGIVSLVVEDFDTDRSLVLLDSKSRLPKIFEDLSANQRENIVDSNYFTNSKMNEFSLPLIR
ncbi:hypothetical protein [Pelagibius sp. Alg239-R121]|uniref:hypothetical protein n=1 Tax=Pelagibius sp. Alg239-R121 TaxID=2993448 RepID=UPI0024A6ADF0|nr:hypothetical protein [Pelagibius sp. Alg239-R121]